MRHVIRSDVYMTIGEIVALVEANDCFLQALPPDEPYIEIWAAAEAAARQIFLDLKGRIEQLGEGCADYHPCSHDEKTPVPCVILETHGQWSDAL